MGTYVRMSTSVLDPPLTAPPPPALLGVDVRALTDDEVGAHLVALHHLRASVEAALVEATGVFDACAAWTHDGARSGPAWVAARCPSSHGAAKADVRLARDLRSMPATAAAFAAGHLGREQVRLLAQARADGLEEAFAACEEVLVDEVAGATVAAGARFLRRWQAEVRERFGLAGSDGPAPAAATRSSVHLSCSFEGRWVLDGSLDAEQGEIVANAVDAQVDALFTAGVFHGDDGLLPSERRAVALVELVTRGARGGDDDGTARPLVIAVTHLHGQCGAAAPLPTLAGHVGRVPADLFGLAELEHAGLVDPATTARWICEGDVQIIGLGDDGHDDLRMGRRIRIANRAQRRALRVRDGGCVFPGCSVAPSHCVAHHVRWWEWGGETDISNLVLVCRHHHKAIHTRGFVMTRENGEVSVTRPDGRSLDAPLRCRVIPDTDGRRPRPCAGIAPEHLWADRARDPVGQDTHFGSGH
jgi:hypothetical protein